MFTLSYRDVLRVGGISPMSCFGSSVSIAPLYYTISLGVLDERFYFG